MKPTMCANAGDVLLCAAWGEGRERPKVTIVVPLYNAFAHVENLLSQLDSTSFIDAELVLVLDGPDHPVEERLLKHEFKWPAVVVTLPTRAGVAVARNTALKWATGNYVWFVDADDAWPGAALTELANAATPEIDIVIGRATRHVIRSAESLPVSTPRAETLDQQLFLRELLNGRIEGYLWNKLIRASAFPSVGAFAPLRTKSDFYGVIGTLPAVRHAKAIPYHVYDYQFQPGSISSATLSTPLDVFRVYEHLVGTLRTAGIKYRSHELAAFVVNTVGRVVIAETARYGDSAVNGVVALEYLHGVLSLKHAISLLAHGRIKLFVLAVAMRFAPGAVSSVYRLRHSRRWNIYPTTPATQGGQSAHPTRAGGEGTARK